MSAILLRSKLTLKCFSQTFINYSKITFANEGTTIVAFHPEQKVPYELTKPLPVEPVVEDTSILKMNDLSEVMRVFKDVHPDAARENLMKLTLTTKHRWFPCGRRRKAKKTPMDRQFL